MSHQAISSPQSKPVRRRDATAKRRREILDAALDCFLRNGVAGTTIEQIRTASNASHGSIYHLFRGKDDIALTLFVEGMQVYHDKIRDSLEQKSTAFECVRTMIATHLRDVIDDPALALYLTRLGMTDNLGEISDRYQALNDDFVQSIWLCLKPFVERGEIVRLPSELYFSLIIGPSSHLARSWLRRRIQCDLLASIDDLAEAAWKSLQPGRSGANT